MQTKTSIRYGDQISNQNGECYDQTKHLIPYWPYVYTTQREIAPGSYGRPMKLTALNFGRNQ